MLAHTHCLHSVPACRGLGVARPARQQCSGAHMVCHASRLPDVPVLERPDTKRRQDPARSSSTRDRPQQWLEAKQGNISQHNQALLRWLDGLTEELETCDAKVLDSELQRTVETALRIQAKDSASHKPVLHRNSAERKGRHRQW